MTGENIFRKIATEDIVAQRYATPEELNCSTVGEAQAFIRQIIDGWVDRAEKRNAHDCTIEWLDSFHRKAGLF